jgi:hypothetical protein
MLRWLREQFKRHEKEPTRRTPVSKVKVICDDKAIVVHKADGTEERMAWSDLACVSIMTTDAGPFESDLFWVLTNRAGRRTTVPIDAAGEHEFLKAMQGRLHGFDNMAVIEAMSSTEQASFVVWEREARA